MSSNVRRTLELGNHYAANKQWHNAGTTFKAAIREIYLGVGPGVPLERVSGLEEALQGLGDDVKRVGDAAPALRQLREAQARAHQGLALERAPYMSTFRVKPIDRWTIVYHDQKEIRTGDITITFPGGAPLAFVLDMEGDKLCSAPLSAARTAQLSYALSHLAWAGVTTAMQLYTVGRVLIRDGLPAIKREARYYHMALLLRPNSPWALAHLGESYRNIANSWPPSVESMTTPDCRVRDYVTALLYFEEAIRLDPDEFWAHAHLGATIVNVRAFTGVGTDIPLLQGLLESWFPNVEAEKRDEALLDKAMVSLREAQRLRGNFYPWAQAYVAGVLVIKSIGLKGSTQELGALSTVMTLDALYLQPQMAAELFEPSELYVNGFYQAGLLGLWDKRYWVAWQYVCMGLGRNFKFQFIPGLQALLGYQLLANIAVEYLGGSTDKEREHVQLPRHVLGDLSQALVPIPAAPIDSTVALLQFIGDIFEKACLPTASPFLDKDVALDTNISVSLIQVCFILMNFQQLLGALDDGCAKAGPSGLSKRMGECITSILARFHLRLKCDTAGYAHHRSDLLMQINTGSLSHHMASMLSVAE